MQSLAGITAEYREAIKDRVLTPEESAPLREGVAALIRHLQQTDQLLAAKTTA